MGRCRETTDEGPGEEDVEAECHGGGRGQHLASKLACDWDSATWVLLVAPLHAWVHERLHYPQRLFVVEMLSIASISQSSALEN